MHLPLSRSTVAANVILATLATVSVALRIVARRKRKLPLKADDYAIFLALILALGLCISGLYAGATNLFAIPVQTMSVAQYSTHEKVIWIDVLLCHIAYGVIKLSILLFYKRIFITPWFQKAANIFMGIVVAWMFAATFGQIFSGKPVDSWWNFGADPEPLLDFKPTINYQIFLAAMAAIDIGLDVFTLLLPVPVIKALHVSTARKVSLLGIFALGFFCVVASAIRLYYTWQLHLVEVGKINPTKATSIFAWNDVWAHIEACASIVTACLPTLAPLAAGPQGLGSLLSSVRSLFTRWGSTLSLLKRDSKGKDYEQSSAESPQAKHSWYKLEARAGAGTHDTSHQVDEESLVGHQASIQEQKSLGSQVKSRV